MGGLNDALHLYKKRHKENKGLSIEEHQKISATLKKIAAHLMNKEVPQEDEEEVQVLPEATIISEEVVHHKKHHKEHHKEHHKKHHKKHHKEHHKKHHKATSIVVSQPKPVVAQPKPAVVAPAKPLVDGTVVKKFIWHTLGGQKNHGPTKAPNMAQLLQGGVRLFNGGKIFFDLGKPN